VKWSADVDQDVALAKGGKMWGRGKPRAGLRNKRATKKKKQEILCNRRNQKFV